MIKSIDCFGRNYQDILEEWKHTFWSLEDTWAYPNILLLSAAIIHHRPIYPIQFGPANCNKYNVAKSVLFESSIFSVPQ